LMFMKQKYSNAKIVIFKIMYFNCIDPSKIESDPSSNRIVYGAETMGMLERGRNKFLKDKGTFSNNSNHFYFII